MVFTRPNAANRMLTMRDLSSSGTASAIIDKKAMLLKLDPKADSTQTSAVASARPGDVILGMSGRDFYGVHGKVLDLLERRDSSV